MKKLLLSLVFILPLGGIVINGFQQALYASQETSQTKSKKSKSGTKKTSLTSKKTTPVSQSTESRGPEWIDGTWVYKGTIPLHEVL